MPWAQALAWRIGRHLLEPVGPESVAGVVRRLGAVLSVDESLAELAVRTRRTTSRPGELAEALATGTIIKSFACRGDWPDFLARGPRAIAAYFRTCGPATLDRLQYWLGDGLSAGRKRLNGWIAGLADRLVAVDVEDTTAYLMREDVESLAASQPSEAVRFLPGHDRWVIGPGTSLAAVRPPSAGPAPEADLNSR